MSSPCPKILVVEDEEAMREVLEMRLPSWGFEISLAASGEEARQRIETFDPDVVLSDVVLPDASGLELLQWLKGGNPDRPVVLMTAYGTVDTAVEAMKEGARDFLTKPLDYQKLREILDAARRETVEPSPQGFGPLVGNSRPMRALYRMIELLAEKEASAIVAGESGTGKELVARAIHDLSRRSSGPFVALNAAAIAEGITESELFGHEKGAFTGAVAARAGCFELADRGTLFLDELGEMPVALQPKLLRVLEDGRVRRVGASRELTFDVRVLAATNRDLEHTVEERRLREDLYYRLNVFTLRVPPLRKRPGDLPLLARHFVRLMNEKHGGQVEEVEADAVELLAEYPWPGNVRELKNVIERAVILAHRGRVSATHLPDRIRRPAGAPPRQFVLPPGVSMAEAEKILILETLERVGNNKAEAARRLGLDVKTIRNRLRAYGEAPSRAGRG